jgi:hypothetical protein
MPPSSIPETDLARIRRWCEQAVPAHLADTIRVEFNGRGRSVTLCESRAPWSPGMNEWDHLPNRQFGSVSDLLAEDDNDPTAIFKG